jgi:phosphatidate cytidylyltransferase
MKRVLSALVLGGIAIIVVLHATRTIGALLVIAVALAAAHEMAGLLESSGCPLSRKPVLAASLLLLACGFLEGVTGISAGLAAGGFLVIAGSVAEGSVKGAVGRSSAGLFILIVPVWSLGHLAFYLSTREDRMALLFLLLCIWVSDTAALYFGSAFGRRKLAPSISPNKTVAGSVAGILGAVCTALLFRLLSLVQWPLSFVVLSGFLVSILGQGGDLVESAVKRDAGVKDSGRLIPGHGGVLDRVDALLFAVPLFYYALAWVQGSLL